MKSEKKMVHHLWLLLPFVFLSFTAQATTNQPSTVVELTPDERTWLEAHPQITIAIPINNPRSYIGSNSRLQGMDIDYIHLLEQRLGIQFEPRVSSWNTALDRAMKHEVDTILNAAKVKKREPYLHFTEIYSSTPQAVIALENEPAISDLNDFCGRKIAVRKGSSRVSFLTENYPCIELIEVTGKKDILSAVITRKADAGFDNFDSIIGNQKEMILPHLRVIYFEYLPPVGFARIGVRKDAPLLVSILNKAILSISEEEKSHIVLKWLGVELPPLPGATEQTAKVDLTESEKTWLRNHPVVRVPVFDFPPFVYWDDGPEGFSVEMLNLVALKTGLKLTYMQAMSRNEALETVHLHKDGDLVLATKYTPGHESSLGFTTSRKSFPLVIFTRDSQQAIYGLEALAGHTVAIERESEVRDILSSRFPEIELLIASGTDEALKKVSNGEAIAYVGTLMVAQHHIASMGLNNLKVAASTDLDDFQMAVAVRKDWPELTSILNKGLDSITSGERSAISRQHLSLTVEHRTDLYQVILWVGGVLAVAGFIVFIVLRGNRRLKQAQEKEQQSAAIYRQLFNHSSSGVAVYEAVDNGLDFIFKDFNKAAEEIDNINRETLLGHKVTEVFPNIKEFGLLDIFRQVWQTGEPALHPVSCYKDTVLQGWRENRVYRLPTGEIVAVYDDITQQKQLEEEKKDVGIRLQRARKMEAIGLMASGVAHDLNNILSGITGYPEILLLKLPKQSDLRQPLEAIKDSGERAAAVVADLLTVARGAASIRVTANLNTLIEEYLDSLEWRQLHSLNQQILCDKKLAESLPNISCSPIHIKKCIMNLITNAVEALDKSGSITISTATDTPDLLWAKEKGLKQNEYVILSVKDTGLGISEEDTEHIFEPFYTRKVMGRSGTGMGLAVVWNTMEDHDGKVFVESSKKGTCFKLYFPADEQEDVNQTAHQTMEPQPTEDNAYILIVDDEPQLRDIASQMLQAFGYRVDSVSSGELAIKFLKANSVDLVVMDMKMEPGMDGHQTYKEILRLYPDQKAIVASGFSESPDVKATLQLGASGFISKPYSMEQLGQAVKVALNG